MRTPQTAVLAIPAGPGLVVPLAGKWLEIIVCSAANLLVGFDQDPPQLMYPGRGYPAGGPNRAFQSVRLVDVSGAGCTVTVVISDEPLAGQEQGLLVGIQQIAQQIAGAAADPVTGQLADTVCPITPGPGQLLFAANPLRTEVEITAPPSNGAGLIYLGITAARATAVDKFIALPAGTPWWSEREKQAIYGCSSTGAEIVNGREC